MAEKKIMQIIITGGAGFLGQRLAGSLLAGSLDFKELCIVDRVLPERRFEDTRVKYMALDLAQDGVADSLVSPQTGIVFHLASVVSAQAEREFDLGWKVNVDATRYLLEACRRQPKPARFVFASSIAVYGGRLPAVVDDFTAPTPQSSYGMQKVVSEYLVNDYSRKGFADGINLRFPTVCIRPGRPNQAASSFVSGIIREPLNGETAICPVSPQLSLWLSSPDTAIANLIHGAMVDAAALGGWRSVNLPGLSVRVQSMLDALERFTDSSTTGKIYFHLDQAVTAIVGSWPSKVDNSRALQLGFKADRDFEDFIRQYLALLKHEGR